MFKGKAIDKYFYELKPCLRGRYGNKQYYTKEEVVSTVKDRDFGLKHVIYALAIYLHRDEFESLTDEFSIEEINKAREKIADRFFDGDDEYVYSNLNREKLFGEIDNFINLPVTSTDNYSYSSDSSDFSDYSGGDSGGDGGF